MGFKGKNILKLIKKQIVDIFKKLAEDGFLTF